MHGAYDSVFIKDSALLVHRGAERTALLASPLFAQRRREQVARAAALEQLSFAVRGPLLVPFEGGDLVHLPGLSGALLGYGQRSSLKAAAGIERFLSAPVLPLELCDPHLYHLDTALAVLSDGTVLLCPEAFSPASLKLLQRSCPSMVHVSRAEALRFGLNLIEVGDAVLLSSEAQGIAAVLRGLGRRVVPLPLRQFHLAGGSAACLVSRVHRPGLQAVSYTTAMRSTWA